MSLEGLCVKVEPDLDACALLTDCTKEEPTYCKDTCTKQESELGVSAALAELYADHQVKGELVLGPELVQPHPQDKSDAPQVSLGLFRIKICEQEPGPESTCHGPPMLRDCFVNLERIHVGKLEESRLTVHRRHTEANESKNSDDTPGKYTKRTYICNACSKQFAVRKLFIQHLRKHKSGAFECNACGRNFAQKLHLTRHSLIHAIDKETNACNTCNKQFVTRSALINHIRQHLGENTCTICSKRFSSINSLDRHNLIHTGQKPFTCDICGMHFRYKVKLVVHIREHTGEAREKKHDQFSRVFHLDNHKRSGEKPFQCEICERRFSASNNLRKHKLTHRKKRPFPCDLCDKQFVRRDNLISHKRLHAGDKLFTCEICEKDFTYKRSLEYHLRIHSQGDNLKPHSCEVCGNLFRIKSHLTRHMRVHTGEKPFSCNICEKSFSLNSTLTTHMRTHTGDKPYGCDMCSKRCTTSSNLLRHKREAHYLAK